MKRKTVEGLATSRLPLEHGSKHGLRLREAGARRHEVIPEPRRLRSTAADLAHVRRKSPEWLTEINYLGLYHAARFRRQRYSLLNTGIRILD